MRSRGRHRVAAPGLSAGTATGATARPLPRPDGAATIGHPEPSSSPPIPGDSRSASRCMAAAHSRRRGRSASSASSRRLTTSAGGCAALARSSGASACTAALASRRLGIASVAPHCAQLIDSPGGRAAPQAAHCIASCLAGAVGTACAGSVSSGSSARTRRAMSSRLGHRTAVGAERVVEADRAAAVDAVDPAFFAQQARPVDS